MKVRILGAGWYGCAIAEHLLDLGHDVEVWESTDRIFAGASGNNPARLHASWHYPRSRLTRAACQAHNQAFLERYGALTRAVPVNLYAVAEKDSHLDFGTYVQVVGSELEYIVVHDPEEFGLKNVEGAVLTGERHIVIERARQHFEERLGNCIFYHKWKYNIADPDYDATIDCTFCALDSASIDRYEPCIVLKLRKRTAGPTDKAVTIMDGPFPSFYPWDERHVSLSSARWTPFSKECRTYDDARHLLNNLTVDYVCVQARSMLDQMTHYYPRFLDEYELSGQPMLSIRAMPHSAADMRLVDIVPVGPRAWRIRAGKIDAVLYAAREVERLLEAL